MMFFHLFMLFIYLLLACAYIDMKAPSRRSGEVDYHNYGYDEFDEGIDFTPTVIFLAVLAVLFHIGVTWYNW